MAMTINRMVAMGGLELSLKVAGTGVGGIGSSKVVGGADKSGAIGSVKISGSF